MADLSTTILDSDKRIAENVLVSRCSFVNAAICYSLRKSLDTSTIMSNESQLEPLSKSQVRAAKRVSIECSSMSGISRSTAPVAKNDIFVGINYGTAQKQTAHAEYVLLKGASQMFGRIFSLFVLKVP